jgi:hypothetical protein
MVCIKSNVTGGINFFMNNWTKNQHHPLQSISLVKPQTTGDIVLTPGSSAGSLHVEVLSEVESESREKEVTQT